MYSLHTRDDLTKEVSDEEVSTPTMLRRTQSDSVLSTNMEGVDNCHKVIEGIHNGISRNTRKITTNLKNNRNSSLTTLWKGKTGHDQSEKMNLYKLRYNNTHIPGDDNTERERLSITAKMKKFFLKLLCITDSTMDINHNQDSVSFHDDSISVSSVITSPCQQQSFTNNSPSFIVKGSSEGAALCSSCIERGCQSKVLFVDDNIHTPPPVHNRPLNTPLDGVITPSTNNGSEEEVHDESYIFYDQNSYTLQTLL